MDDFEQGGRPGQSTLVHTHMATPKRGGAAPTEDDESVPIAWTVSEVKVLGLWSVT